MEFEKKGKKFSFGFGTADTVGMGNLSDMKKAPDDLYESKILKNFRKAKNATKSAEITVKFMKLINKR